MKLKECREVVTDIIMSLKNHRRGIPVADGPNPELELYNLRIAALRTVLAALSHIDAVEQKPRLSREKIIGIVEKWLGEGDFFHKRWIKNNKHKIADVLFSKGVISKSLSREEILLAIKPVLKKYFGSTVWSLDDDIADALSAGSVEKNDHINGGE